MQRAAKAANLPIRDFRPEEGENWKDVNARARDFIINEILKNWFQPVNSDNDKEEEKTPSGNKSEMKNILIVAHGGFIMEFINVIKSLIAEKAGTPHQDVFKNNAKNTCVNIFALR